MRLEDAYGKASSVDPDQSKRIFNSCEVQIENSVTRVTVRHLEACRVMPNSYPSDGIFNLHRKTIMDSFSCIHFLRKLYFNVRMHYYINIMLNYLHFRSRHDRFGFYLRRLHQNVWQKMTSKLTCDVKKTPSHHARESSFISHVRRHFLAPVGFTEIPVGYARMSDLELHC